LDGQVHSDGQNEGWQEDRALILSQFFFPVFDVDAGECSNLFATVEIALIAPTWFCSSEEVATCERVGHATKIFVPHGKLYWLRTPISTLRLLAC
jgi:hypothetical protein